MIAKLLVIEDQRITRRLVATWFEKYEGWEVEEAATLAEAIALLRQNVYDCIVLDLNLSDSSGLDTFKKVGALTTAPVVVFTAYDNDALRTSLLDAGVCGVITKKAGTEQELQDTVVGCIAKRRTQDGTDNLLTLKGRKGTIITWFSGGAGAVAFVLIAGLEAYWQLQTTHTYRPPDWVVAILTSTLGIGAYKAVKGPQR